MTLVRLIILVVAGLSVMIPADATAQLQLVRLMKSNQASKRGVGSAGYLTGHVYVYHVFVSDQESIWELLFPKQPLLMHMIILIPNQTANPTIPNRLSEQDCQAQHNGKYGVGL